MNKAFFTKSHGGIPSAMIEKCFLKNRGVVEIIHSHCSPDLTPAECFLFSKVKATIKKRSFITSMTSKQR